jgi:nitrate reductase assembly molybdenum cofactor insertion protein NarJ
MTTKTDESLGGAFVLASLICAYPEESFAENMKQLLENQLHSQSGGTALSSAYGALQSALLEVLANPERVDELRSEYIDLFDRGRQVNSLYETEYGRERSLAKGTELVDIAAFYRAFGFETGGDGVRAEMIDHVSVELEYYALLVLKTLALTDLGDQEGIAIVLDARKKFLTSHLGRYVGAIAERPGVMDSPFYRTVFSFCKELVADECRRLGLEIRAESWISADAELPDISCGGSLGCKTPASSALNQET